MRKYINGPSDLCIAISRALKYARYPYVIVTLSNNQQIMSVDFVSALPIIEGGNHSPIALFVKYDEGIKTAKNSELAEFIKGITEDWEGDSIVDILLYDEKGYVYSAALEEVYVQKDMEE